MLNCLSSSNLPFPCTFSILLAVGGWVDVDHCLNLARDDVIKLWTNQKAAFEFPVS